MTDTSPRPPDPYLDILTQHPGSRLTPDEVEFGRAMQEYQTRTRRRYPAWSEVLYVLRLLGYAKARPENGEGGSALTPNPSPSETAL